MISFGQILILAFLAFLLFGDSRQFFNRVILFFVNMKALSKKILSERKNDASTTNR